MSSLQPRFCGRKNRSEKLFGICLIINWSKGLEELGQSYGLNLNLDPFDGVIGHDSYGRCILCLLYLKTTYYIDTCVSKIRNAL